MFADPMAIMPGQIYVASYWAPAGSYAATNDYFADQEVTAGPITALRAVGADGNGVYSYSETTTFPDFSYRNTNHWVTPLWGNDVPPPGDDGGDDDDESDDDDEDEGDDIDDDGGWSWWRRWSRGRR